MPAQKYILIPILKLVLQKHYSCRRHRYTLHPNVGSVNSVYLVEFVEDFGCLDSIEFVSLRAVWKQQMSGEASTTAV